jgi:putative endonuclease
MPDARIAHARSAVERGRCAEEIAAQWLRLNSIHILDRNRRAAGGEIDLVARDGDTLVFVEVRMRRSGSWTGAGDSIDARKWQRLRSCARALARETTLIWPRRRMRFDVVLLTPTATGFELRHLRNVTRPANHR